MSEFYGNAETECPDCDGAGSWPGDVARVECGTCEGAGRINATLSQRRRLRRHRETALAFKKA